jgi:anthranilate phosphoribosyltransferase
MQALKPFTEILTSGVDLTIEQAGAVAELLTRPDIPVAEKQTCLLALADKGETATEVVAFARAFRSYAVNPGVEEWAGRAIDVCGTGGDGSGTFNISTAVSFIVAAVGVPVFKHGNRSITSKCGSADLLEALGIRIDAPKEGLHDSLRELNFCFFFAPAYHPAFKEIMPVRRVLAEAGRRTIFNLLGPLINPGRPAHQLLGVFSEQWVQPLAYALDDLGLKAGLVVHGRASSGEALDELSCAGENHLAGFGKLSGVAKTLKASDLGLPECDFSDLAGSDVAGNVAVMHALLSGSADAVPAGLRNSVLLNAGLALWISGRVSEMTAGVALAEETLRSGRVETWLKRARSFYEKR